MKNKHRNKVNQIISATVLIIVALNWVFMYRVPPVSAAEISDLCVPPNIRRISGGNWIFEDWIELSFRNRAEITMRKVGPSGCPSDQVSSDGLQFSEIIQGYMRDENTADPTMRYEQRQGEASSDDSRIDNFDEETKICEQICDNADARDGRGGGIGGSGRDRLSESFQNNDRSILKGVEFTLSFEDALAPSITTCGSNSNFALGMREGGGETIEWRCAGGGRHGVGELRGARIREQLQNLPNFNIVYNYIGDEVIHVSQNERNKRTFKRMTGPSGDAPAEHYRSEEGRGDLWLAVTKAQLDAIGAGVLPVQEHRDGNPSKITTVVAGAENASSVNSDANPSRGSGERPEDECDAESGLTWIICGTIRMVQDALDKTGSMIDDLLFADPSVVQQGSPAYRSWKGFRDLANAGLVIVFVIIIYAQATGGKS